MIQYLIPILVFASVVSLGLGIVFALRLRRNMVTTRLLQEGATIALTPEEHRHRVLRIVSRFGNAFSLGRSSNTLKARLARAGYYGESAAATYVGVKLLMLVTGLTAGAFAVSPFGFTVMAKVYLVLLAGALLFFVPNLIVRSRLSARRTQIQRHLPDAIDLLEVCVSSGMGLDMAWNAVGDEIRGVSPVLADEMALANLEMQLGASRTSALRNLAERSGADEFASLVALLVQSERFGTSVSDALNTFAKSMRESRSQRAEEAAERMSVKLLFPLVLFIFPVMLIVMVGPAALKLVEIMAN